LALSASGTNLRIGDSGIEFPRWDVCGMLFLVLPAKLVKLFKIHYQFDIKLSAGEIIGNG